MKLRKQIFDLFFATCSILFLLPLVWIVLILLVLVVGRPIIFKQKRLGLNAKPFTIYKFRTLEQTSNKNGNHNETALKIFLHFLRTTGLDEVPSIINVFRGELSIVGPRPLLPLDYTVLDEICFERFLIQPGLTGLAQISGRNVLSWRRRLMYDLLYYNDRGIAVDARIVAKTIPVLLSYRSRLGSRRVSGMPLAREIQK